MRFKNDRFYIGLREQAFIHERLRKKYGENKEFTDEEMRIIRDVAIITCKMSKGAYYLEEER